MRRSLFFAFFLRLTVAMALILVLRMYLVPRGWWLTAGLVLGWASLNAYLLSRAVRASIVPLQRSAATIAEAPAGDLRQRFSDFDGLARAISRASVEVSHALAEAARSRHELEAMIDSMQDAVVAVDAAGRIQWTNERMQKLIPGSSVSSVVRVGHALVQTIRDPEVLECVRFAVAEREHCQRRSTSMLPGRIFEINASPMPAGGAVAVLHDITRIEQVERTQRDFVANVSHELRTPLTSISGYVETLLDHETALTSQARSFLETIHNNTTRMNRLTEDLLLMARVESAEADLRPTAVPAKHLVEEAVRAMSGMLQDERAVLEVGEVTAEAVFADSDAVVQVLSHLIENGIKYGRGRDSDGARVRITAATREEPFPAVEFCVADGGPGIASEHLPRIFERFYRVDKARSRESGGTGLGLSIARHVVQSLGGDIRVESQLNQGSSFLVTLPRPASPEISATSSTVFISP